ncbi:MAG: RNA polymerase sigma factor [Pseudohongiellaceae bacterium]
MNQQLLELLPVLRRFSWSLTNSAHDADDLLQATVERLLSKGVPDDVGMEKWAFTVCRNLWIDDYRSRKVRKNAEWDPMLTDRLTTDGERDMHAQLDLARVNKAIEELPKDQHLVLSMVTVQGLSYQGVAETLEIPIGTVMSRLARARVRLAELLKPCSGESHTTDD